MLPLRGNSSGPAPKSEEDKDVVDEAIQLFRATIMFKNFKPEGPADKMIVYLTVFIQKCLQEVQRKGIACEKATAMTVVDLLAKEVIPASSDSKFFMRALGLLT
jgi:actin related protein 2/3 complex subunit 3